MSLWQTFLHWLQRPQIIAQNAAELGLEQAPDQLFATLLQAVPKQFQGAHRHMAAGKWQKMQVIIFEAEAFRSLPATIVGIQLKQSAITLPKFIWRPIQTADLLKNQIGYQFLTGPSRYRSDMILLLLEDDPDLAEKLNNSPSHLWTQTSEPYYWVCDGSWFVYMRLKSPFPTTISHMELLLSEATRACRTLADYLQ